MELTDKLNSILLEKKFGPDENKVILNCFNIILNNFRNQSKLVNEFISSVQKLNDFKIVDVNDDSHLKDNIIEASKQDIKLAKFVYKKVGDKFIKSEDGNYILRAIGNYIPSINKIEIINEDIDRESAFFHELEHSTQLGFNIPTHYFGSAEISKIFYEGDAMDYQLSMDLYQKDNYMNILINNIPYSFEYNIFNHFKLLLGNTFIDDFKCSKNDDYMRKIIEFFDKNDAKEELQEILSICYFISNPNTNQKNMDNLSLISNYYNNDVKHIKQIIKQHKKEITELEKEIPQLEQQVMINKNILNDSSYVNAKVKQEMAMYQEDLEEYKKVAATLKSFNGDKQKIKEFVISTGSEYDESIDYIQFTNNAINEIQQMINPSEIENEIRTSMTKKMFKLHSQIDLKRKQKNEVETNYQKSQEEVKPYQLSCDVITDVSKMYSKYQSLNNSEKTYFKQCLLVKVELLFHQLIEKNKEFMSEPISFLIKYHKLIHASTNYYLLSDSPNNDNNYHQQFLELIDKLQYSRMNLLKKLMNCNTELDPIAWQSLVESVEEINQEKLVKQSVIATNENLKQR